MEKISLSASTLPALKKGQAAALRKENKIPAVVYGHGTPTRQLLLSAVDFDKAYRAAGESTLVDLTIDGAESVKTLIHDVQVDPVSRRIAHVDFHQVRMDEKIHAQIKLHFVGQPPAVKELGGVLVTNLDEVEVECLPGNLVESFEVDLSSLATFDDVVTVANIKLPEGVRMINDLADVIALVQAPRSESELASLEEKPTQALPAEAAEPAKEAAAPAEASK